MMSDQSGSITVLRSTANLWCGLMRLIRFRTQRSYNTFLVAQYGF